MAFYNCYELESEGFDVSHWDTSNCTDMYMTFDICKKLTRLDLSNRDTANVTVFSAMFQGCNELKDVDFSNFDLSSVSQIGGLNNMFQACDKLSDDALYSIVTMLATSRTFGSDQTLKKIGLTSTQATKCTSFDNWQSAQNKGWSSGY